MIDVMPDMNKALSENQCLVSLLGSEMGKEPIFYMIVPESRAQDFPRITFFEVINDPDLHADNREIASFLQVQVSIWTLDGDATEIANEVCQTMISLGFSRAKGGADLYENETGVFHKALRFNKTMMEG